MYLCYFLEYFRNVNWYKIILFILLYYCQQWNFIYQLNLRKDHTLYYLYSLSNVEAFEDRIYLLFPLAIQPPIEWSSYQSLRNSVISFLIVSRSAPETCILYRLKLFSGANKKSNGKEGEKKRRRGISNRVTSQREQTKENEREKERERRGASRKRDRSRGERNELVTALLKSFVWTYRSGKKREKWACERA